MKTRLKRYIDTLVAFALVAALCVMLTGCLDGSGGNGGNSGGGTESDDSIVFYAGHAYNVEAETAGNTVLSAPDPGVRTGYVCTGWYDNAAFSGAPVAFPYTYSGRAALYARWQRLDVVYVLNGGDNDERNPEWFLSGETEPVDLHKPKKTGYAFTGWYDNAALEGAPVTSVRRQAEPVMLYAGWEQVFFNLPVVQIHTNGAPVTDTGNYVPASIDLLNCGGASVEFEGRPAEIRLRGNTTATLPKKPYRIKFDKKTDLFGRGAYRSWVLLADYWDASNIKNYSGLTFAAKMEYQAFAPAAVHVDVYLDGVYQGLYLLSDHVQEDEGRLGVEEPLGASQTAFPFYVELDEYAPQEGTYGKDLFSLLDAAGVQRHFLIKYPEPGEGLTEAAYAYIVNYITTVNTVIRSGGDYAAYIDVNSFIDYYLIQELHSQGEINKKSVKMSKTSTGKLTMGPVWDFDWAVGGPWVAPSGAPAAPQWRSNGNWFSSLLNSPAFVSALKARWPAVKNKFAAHIDSLIDYKPHIRAAAIRNATLWFSALPNYEALTFDNAFNESIATLTVLLHKIDALIVAL